MEDQLNSTVAEIQLADPAIKNIVVSDERGLLIKQVLPTNSNLTGLLKDIFDLSANLIPGSSSLPVITITSEQQSVMAYSKDSITVAIVK